MPPLFFAALPVIIVVVVVVIIVVTLRRLWLRLRRLWLGSRRRRLRSGLWIGLRIRLRLWLRFRRRQLRLRLRRRRLRSGRWAGVWLRRRNTTGRQRQAAAAALRAFWGQGQDKAPIDVRSAGGEGKNEEQIFHPVTSGGAGRGIQWVGLKSTSYQSPLD